MAELKNLPLVSAVIPTYRRPELVLRAVNCCLAQTYPNMEVVVVVDGPDAEVEAVLAAVNDDRLQVVVNPVNSGQAQCRNLGVRNARGEWIAFLDDDDEWMPTKLERQLALPMPPSGRVLLSCRSAYVTPHGTSVRPRERYDGKLPIDEWLFDRRQMFGGQSFIQTSSLLLPKTLFDESVFPAHGQHEDWEFVITAVKRLGAQLLTAPEILVRHHAEEERPSLSASGRLDGSLRWIAGMQGSVTKRAFSGFCLTVVANQARRSGGWRPFAHLLFLAFRHGRPTPVQLFVFLTVWGIPPRLHKVLRRLRPGTGQPATGSVAGEPRVAS